ncbi:MAG: hypothetical protein ACE5FG_13510 [Myxococcota bacterium]
MCGMRLRLATVFLLACAGVSGQSRGDPARRLGDEADVASAAPSVYQSFRAALARSPSLQALWEEAERFEEEERLLESARGYERVSDALPREAHPCWRVARSYWRFADDQPPEAKRERIRYLEQARDWAALGLERDERCAGCMLWKVAALGRLATTRGVWSGIRSVSEMAELLERGIALRPRYADGPSNSLLGNLYLASAKLNRILPDSLWMRWLTGVRGNKERGLEHARRAVALLPERIDYRVELGVALLCLGERRHHRERIREARSVLSRAAAMPPLSPRDFLARQHAAMLLEHPDRACGYSRDGQIEIESAAEVGPEAPSR